jgi:hypothetical protein
MHYLWRKDPLVISIAPTFSARLLRITGICNASGKWGDFTVFVLLWCSAYTSYASSEMRQSVLCGNFHMHASTGITDKYFFRKIKGARNGFTHWLPENEIDIVNYTNISHNNFSGRVAEDQWCDTLSFGLMHIWDA